MKEVSRSLRTLLIGLLLVVTAPVWLSLVVLTGAVYLIWTCALYAVVWVWWIGRRRRRVLFVYSDSPVWKEHIEQRILPRLSGDSVVLNWSARQQWPRFTLPVLLFRRFAGQRDFNPIALVFTRFALVERFRFWRPFRDARHGKDESLRSLEASLFERLEV